MAKVDAIRAEFPDLSPNDLVTTKKINTDQRAQIDKKPALQAQLAQLEEHLGALLKVEEDFRKRFKAEKERLETAHRQELEDAKKLAKSNEDESSGKELRQKLLVLSKFLRAAAARRQVEEDDSVDGRGFEGVLLLLYGGDIAAVDAAERVINGNEDKIPSTEGILLDVNCEKDLMLFPNNMAFQRVIRLTANNLDGRIKQLALEFAPFADEEAWIDNVAQAEEPNESQPTQELNGTTSATSNALATASNSEENAVAPPAQTSVDPGAANDMPNNGLAKTPSEGEELGDSWVSVPSENVLNVPAATETQGISGLSNEPTTGTASWADDANDAAARSTGDTHARGQDGFHEVRGRGGRARGGWGDSRGGGRGRGGFRGGPDGARGRGGFRGDRGGDGTYRARGRGGRGRGREGS